MDIKHLTCVCSFSRFDIFQGWLRQLAVSADKHARGSKWTGPRACPFACSGARRMWDKTLATLTIWRVKRLGESHCTYLQMTFCLNKAFLRGQTDISRNQRWRLACERAQLDSGFLCPKNWTLNQWGWLSARINYANTHPWQFQISPVLIQAEKTPLKNICCFPQTMHVESVETCCIHRSHFLSCLWESPHHPFSICGVSL